MTVLKTIYLTLEYSISVRLALLNKQAEPCVFIHVSVIAVRSQQNKSVKISLLFNQL